MPPDHDDIASLVEVKRLCALLKTDEGRPALVEILIAIEESLDYYGMRQWFHSNKMGATLLGRCPAFAAFCKPWESQVFGKVLLARMNAEDAGRKLVNSTAPFPHHRYKK